MATNLGIDEDLLIQAQKAGRFKSKKATVNHALREFIEHRKQLKILDLFGNIPFDAKYDHKKGRRR